MMQASISAIANNTPATGQHILRGQRRCRAASVKLPNSGVSGEGGGGERHQRDAAPTMTTTMPIHRSARS